MLIVLDERQLNAGSADVSSAQHAQHAHLFLQPSRPTLFALRAQCGRAVRAPSKEIREN